MPRADRLQMKITGTINTGRRNPSTSQATSQQKPRNQIEQSFLLSGRAGPKPSAMAAQVCFHRRAIHGVMYRADAVRFPLNKRGRQESKELWDRRLCRVRLQ